MIKPSNLLHIFAIKLEFDNLEILLQPLKISRHRNYNMPTLQSPSQRHLVWCNTMLQSDFLNYFILTHHIFLIVSMIARTCNRPICSDMYIQPLLRILHKLPLLKVRIQLYLIHGGLDLAPSPNFSQQLSVKIWHPYILNQSLFYKPFKLLPYIMRWNLSKFMLGD